MTGPPTDWLVVGDDWPKYFDVDGHAWRAMLPTGMHCQVCHRLVTADPANVGCLPDHGFRAVFDTDTVLVLLRAHMTFGCRNQPTVPDDPHDECRQCGNLLENGHTDECGGYCCPTHTTTGGPQP